MGIVKKGTSILLYTTIDFLAEHLATESPYSPVQLIVGCGRVVKRCVNEKERRAGYTFTFKKEGTGSPPPPSPAAMLS